MDDITVEEVSLTELEESEFAQRIITRLREDKVTLAIHQDELGSVIAELIAAIQDRNFDKMRRLVKSITEWLDRGRKHCNHLVNTAQTVIYFCELFDPQD